MNLLAYKPRISKSKRIKLQLWLWDVHIRPTHMHTRIKQHIRIRISYSKEIEQGKEGYGKGGRIYEYGCEPIECVQQIQQLATRPHKEHTH